MTADQISMLPSMAAEKSLRDRLPAIRAVYFLLSQDARVLYVGRSSRLNIRWSSHEHRKYAAGSGCRVAWLDCSSFSRESVQRLEMSLIAALNPPLNRNGIPPDPNLPTRKPSRRLFLPLTKKEFAWIKAAAAAKQMTVTSLVREALNLPAAKRGRPAKEKPCEQ